jgi:hypothetical protein
MHDENLRQADLSHLEVKDMTPEQRAELKRRYDAFVRDVARRGPVRTRLPGAPKKLVKWVPGKRA